MRVPYKETDMWDICCWTSVKRLITCPVDHPGVSSMHMMKWVSQGSILIPLLLNIFLNDIYFVLSQNGSVYNYADDNAIGSFHDDIFELKEARYKTNSHIG